MLHRLRFYLLPALLSVACGHSLSAQTAPAALAYPRYFMGASCMLGNYELTYPRIRSYDEDVLSPGLTLGYQFAERGAVQVSIEKSRTILQIEIAKPVGTSQARDSYYVADHRNFAIPVVLRLTGTKRTSRRLQFDVLAGFVIIHASYSRNYNRYDDQQNIIYHEEQAEQTTNVALSIGGGIRYRLGRHLEAVGDANLNRTISPASTSGFVNVYTTGLRYHFGYQ